MRSSQPKIPPSSARPIGLDGANSDRRLLSQTYKILHTFLPKPAPRTPTTPESELTPTNHPYKKLKWIELHINKGAVSEHGKSENVQHFPKQNQKTSGRWEERRTTTFRTKIAHNSLTSWLALHPAHSVLGGHAMAREIERERGGKKERERERERDIERKERKSETPNNETMRENVRCERKIVATSSSGQRCEIAHTHTHTHPGEIKNPNTPPPSVQERGSELRARSRA